MRQHRLVIKNIWLSKGFFVTLCWVAFLGCRSSNNDQAAIADKALVVDESDDSYELLEYEELLTGGAKDSEPLPLIIAVHGLGDRPRNFRGLIDSLPTKARVILPRAPISWGSGYAWFETRVASGNFDKLATGIGRAAKQNADLVKHLLKTRNVRGRPIFLGFSQGGMVSFAMAFHHPKNIGLVIPISGLLPKPLWPNEKKPEVEYPKVRALHGGLDNLVAIEPTRQAVKYLSAKGFDVKLTEYSEASHTINLAMRKELFRLIEEATSKN